MFLAFLTLLFFIVAFENILFWTNLWQLKEYRLDRLFVHIRDTQQGRSIFLSSQTIVLFLAFLSAFLGNFFDLIAHFFPFITFLLLGFLAINSILLGVHRQLKRPVFTAKSTGICVISFILVGVSLFFPLTDPALWLFIILFFVPILIAFVVVLFAFPTEIYTDIYIQKARKKREDLKALQVIAISGSYGKSSTKEIVAHVLSHRFTVVKTAFSNNTPLAIAKTILAKVNEDTDFFVVELGAYKRGEIRQLANIVGPTVSVTTAISDQHLALYGDMNDVVESELELLKEMPKSGLVLLNGNSKDIEEMAKKIKQTQVVWYTTKKSKRKNTVHALNIISSVKGTRWIYQDKRNFIPLISPLLGIHTVENILPAVFLGKYYGLPDQDIQKAIKSLTPLPKTMEQIKQVPGVRIIDDSFNASPESVLAAITYLMQSHGRRILVLSPLIELGKMGNIRHKEIGQAAKDIDFILLTNKNFLPEIKNGLLSKNAKTKIITGSYTFLAKSLEGLLQKGDTVVFEGKEAGIVLKKI